MLEGGRVGPDVPEDVFLACHLDLSLCGALLLEVCLRVLSLEVVAESLNGMA